MFLNFRSKLLQKVYLSTSSIQSKSVEIPVLKHLSIVERKNKFIKSKYSWIRDFKSFSPLEPFSISSLISNPNIRHDIIHQSVKWFLACKRAGTASTKERGQVSGSGRKLHAQKGTGRARAGSSRVPHRRGGGICFGPRPRDFSYILPSKLQKLAIRHAISAMFVQGKLSFISSESLKLDCVKTKDLVSVINKISSRKILVLDTENFSKNLVYCNRPLKDRLTLFNCKISTLNPYHLLNCSKVLITERAYEYLLKTCIQ